MRNLCYLLFVCCLVSRYSAQAQASFFDPTFGNGGKVTIPAGHGVFHSVAIQSDGKIIAAGSVGNSGAIVRYKTNGTCDSTFGLNGYYLGTPYESAEFYDVAIQPDGKIIAISDTSISFSDDEFYILRLNLDGSRDMTFGIGGVATVDFTIGHDNSSAIKLQPDGKIVVLGTAATSIGIIRLLTDGSLDGGFGTAGKATYSTFGNATDVDIAPDGKIVLGGQRYSGYELMAIRLLANGTPDNSFNGSGMAYALVGDTWNYGRTVAVQPDGKIIVAGSGTMAGEGSNVAAIRFNTDGALDGTFGAGGKVNLDINGSDDEARAIDVSADGKILLCGAMTSLSESDFGVVRLDENGILDNAFGISGKIVNPIGAMYDVPHAVALQSDGKIVLAGSTYGTNVSQDTPAIARYLTSSAGISIAGYSSKQISLFPNPASGRIYLPSEIVDYVVSANLVDAFGKTSTAKFQFNEGWIDVSHIANGLYWVILSLCDGNVVSEKAVIEHK